MNPPDPDGVPSSDARVALLGAGLRLTRQRAAVYSQLLSLNHPTAEEVFRKVQNDESSVSLATTYKALDALVQSGLATKMTTASGTSRYDARRDHHYHLVCSRSGAVEDLATNFDPELIAKIDPQLLINLDERGFRVTGYRLEVVGYFYEGPTTGNPTKPVP